jgi:hypothetical protein
MSKLPKSLKFIQSNKGGIVLCVFTLQKTELYSVYRIVLSFLTRDECSPLPNLKGCPTMLNRGLGYVEAGP